MQALLATLLCTRPSSGFVIPNGVVVSSCDSSSGYERRSSTALNVVGANAASAGGFSRHPNDDLSFDVNIDAVNELLKKRKKARKSQNFGQADFLQRQLLEGHSVLTDDATKTWRTTAHAGSLLDSNRFRAGDTDTSSGEGAGGGSRSYGFSLCADAGPNSSDLSESDILDMIGERMLARKGRNFPIADRIRNELKERGVYLDDNAKEWRADGNSFGADNDRKNGSGNRNGDSNTSASDGIILLAKSEHSSPVLSAEDEGVVTNLLALRARYRKDQNYENADSVRDDLLRRFDVHINDRLEEWSAGGDFGDNNFGGDISRDDSYSVGRNGGGGVRVYQQSEHSDTLEFQDDEEYVQRKVEERLRAKKKRNYVLADQIREELLHRYGVTIQDDIHQWSVGGDFGEDAPRNRGEYTPTGMMGRFSAEQCAAISVVVNKRHEAKRERRFETADKIRDSLFDKYGIVIDDKRFRWSFKEGQNEVPEGRGRRGEEPRLQSTTTSSQNDDSASVDDGEATDTDGPTSTSSGEDGDAPSRRDLMSLTVVQLKEKLRACGEKVGGKKEELVDRLLLQ